MGEMSKSLEEIKKGLECCKPLWKSNHWKTCDQKCPYTAEGTFCKNILNSDALTLIQQLEANDSQVKKALQDNGFGSLEEFLQAFSQVKRERDAAVADIHKTCSTCKLYYYNRQDGYMAECMWIDDCTIEDHWEWRGVQEPTKQEGENDV